MTLATVTIEVLDPTPPYEQLRRQLADLIGAGVLSPGERLPPVRQLAADLGLAAGTVARTYKELEQSGYVRSRRGGGTRVAATAPASSTPVHALEEAATAYLERARALGLTDDDAVTTLNRLTATSPRPGGRPTPAGG
jgi:DNA-binding transcriptional regulator YhcF (GntR family)